jgi:hypothetical protein
MALNPFDPNFDSNIPNNPFYWPEQSSFQTPQGPLIFGGGISVDYATGTVSVDPVPPNSLGTVTSVTAGVGIATLPPSGIIASGTVSLATVPTVVPGTYTYAAITVDAYGRITLAQSGLTPVQAVTGLYPIIVTGSAPSLTVSIVPSSTTNSGAVQLVDNLSTPSDSLALTANQGYLLQQQISAISATSGIQFLGGTLNASTTNVVTATTDGITAGITAGIPLPAPSGANIGAVMIVTTAGTYTPPGGTAVSAVAGDQFLSDGTNWVHFLTGFRAPYATTTNAGIVRYATVAETQALADNTIAVTPFSLSGMIASTTQRGFVELADVAETQALTDSTRAVTPAGLGTLQATTTARGLVQLDDTLTSTSTTTAPTARALKQAFDESIHKDIIQANGDLIVGRAAADPQILSKGFNGQVLTVDNTATLGLAWKTPVAPEATPIGAICWFTTDDPAKLPVGWLVADGSSYPDDPADSYFPLYEVIGLTFTPGTDPGGTFRVPDLRGQFIRGWNDAGTQGPGTLDTGRLFGSTQGDAYQQHSHSVTDPGHIHSLSDPGHNHTVADPGHSHAVNDPGHSHQFNVPNAEVVGNTAGFYDGDNKIGERNVATTNSSAALVINANTVGLVPNNALTNLTQTVTDETDLTVDNSPPSAPVPNETRPVNFALLPIIKYRNPT